MGRHILDQLLAKNNHSITALTRINSNISLDPSITVHEVDYNDIPNLTTALHDHEILIITLSVTTPPSVHSNLVQAAAAAGIKYIIPNAYGFNFRNPALLDDIPVASKTASYIAEIEKLGLTHFSLVCSFWYEWSLGVPFLYGIDIAARKAIFYDEGNTVINTSTWKLCGDAVAGIVALPIEELEEKWKNKSFYVSSFRVSQRQMLDSVHRVLGTKDGEWEIEYQTTKQRYEDGLRDMQKGDFTGFARCKFWSFSFGLLRLTKEQQCTRESFTQTAVAILKTVMDWTTKLWTYLARTWMQRQERLSSWLIVDGILLLERSQ
jgi:hypothetical protein